MSPYIQDHRIRKLYDEFLKSIINVLHKVPKKKQHGHLNYIITRLVIELKPHSYKEFNAIIGVLECMKLELYRRMIAPYEDKKIEENGDVYE